MKTHRSKFHRDRAGKASEGPLTPHPQKSPELKRRKVYTTLATATENRLTTSYIEAASRSVKVGIYLKEQEKVPKPRLLDS